MIVAEGLTSKEEAFARAVALEGLGISDAYRASRDASRMTPACIHANAKRVARRSRVKLRIEELRGQVAPGNHGLTPRQEAFCMRYLQTGGASTAYRWAYEVGPLTKPETVHRSAHTLIQNPKIAARLAYLRAGLWRRYEVAIDRLVEEYARLAFSNIADLIDWDSAAVTRDPESGDIVATANRVTIKADAPRSALAAVESVEITKRGFKLRMHDKVWALDGLARYLGLFDDGHKRRSLAAARAAGGENGSITFWRMLATSAPNKAEHATQTGTDVPRR